MSSGPMMIVRYHTATWDEQRHAVDATIVGIIGLAWMALGLVAVTRAGVDGPFSQPVVEVLGFTHTATLGAGEITIGSCLIVCAVTASRAAAIFFGFVLVVSGIVSVAHTDSLRASLALESRLAWIAVLAGGIVIAVSTLFPRMSHKPARPSATES